MISSSVPADYDYRRVETEEACYAVEEISGCDIGRVTNVISSSVPGDPHADAV